MDGSSICTSSGTDNDLHDRQRGRVPTDPIPDWVLTRRRAIGDQVRASRKVRRLSQEKLGELSGLDRKTINRLEQASHDTSISHLLLVAAALDVPVSDLVRWPAADPGD